MSVTYNIEIPTSHENTTYNRIVKTRDVHGFVGLFQKRISCSFLKKISLLHFKFEFRANSSDKIDLFP